MKSFLCSGLGVALVVASLPDTRARGEDLPTVGIEWLSDHSVRIEWTNTAAPFVLEEAGALGNFNLWQLVPQPTPAIGGVSSVTVESVLSSRFFRLRTPDLTRLSGISPADGETGVSVTRETILRFNYPLAAGTLLDSTRVFAEFGGRHYLSRVELSSDRQTVTLFYLEPLPGSARMQVTFDAPGLTDQFGRLVDLDGDGKPGGVARFQFDTLSLTPLPGTAILGTVYASDLVPGVNTKDFVNRPLKGATITVDGMEQTLRAVTDSNGFFRLSPCPAGDFFVHIDGRTVTDVPAGIRYPDLAYYPFVGKVWHAVAGSTNNLAGGTGLVYLPLVAQGTLQAVSSLRDTTITFPDAVIAANPALAGVSITVPANSLYSDNGTRGGRVGIAPVPPDRLPGPLPPGLEVPLVITVQTDGPLNFDKPAPVCFPNLPDPATGTPAPPGSKRALVSFNHKKGKWEAVGSMTVSPDGRFVWSDPGSGVLWPGWHAAPPPPVEPDGPNPQCSASAASPAASFVAPADGVPSDFTLQCMRRCQVERDLDRRGCQVLRGNLLREVLRCINRFPPGHARDQCTRGLQDDAADCDHLTDQTYTRCMARCRENPFGGCFGFGTDSSSPSAKAFPRLIARDTAPVDQVVQLLGEEWDFLSPYLQAVDPIPSPVLDHLANTLQQMDSLAGGSAIGLLRQSLAELEREEQDINKVIGWEEGDAPDYAIDYLATVLRANGELLSLRGRTERKGRYSIFVPADGTLLRVAFFDRKSWRSGSVTPRVDPLWSLKLPNVYMMPVEDALPDVDQDGLPDFVERILDTDPLNPDSDGDGIPDGAEVVAGTDPLDGRFVLAGVVASADTPGNAVDVCAGNGVAFVADSAAGVAVFNIADGTTPLHVAQVDTPGFATAVCLSGTYLAVADGPAGVAIVDVSNPARARVVRQVALPGTTITVAALGRRLFAGGYSPDVSELDFDTGALRGTLSLGGIPVQDLVLNGDYLYALQNNQLNILSILDGGMRFLRSVPAPGTSASGTERQRLSVGGGRAFSVHSYGYSSFNLADPARPQPIYVSHAENPDLFGWFQVVLTGSDPTPVVRGSFGPDDVALFELGAATGPGVFLNQLVTPGQAHAATLYNGLLYVADGTAGLQVVNFRRTPLPGGEAPRFTLDASFALNPAVAEASRMVWVTADVPPTVQVRTVEVSTNGVPLSTVGGFPYRVYFQTPALGSDPSPSFTLGVKVTDTAGRSTTTQVTVALAADLTPPRVKRVYPSGGDKVVTRVAARFNGLLNPASLNASTFQLVAAGMDEEFDTPDDVGVAGGAFGFDAENNDALLQFETPLTDGRYRVLLTTGIADPAGNHLQQPVSWEFRVADAVFWSSPFGGKWNVATNWSTGAVPGPLDDVVILPPGDAAGGAAVNQFVVSIGQIVPPIRSLALYGSVSNAGTLDVTGEVTCYGDLTINSGTLRHASVRLLNDSKLIVPISGIATLEGVSLLTDVVFNSAQQVLVSGGFACERLVLDHSATISFSGQQTVHAGTLVLGPAGGAIQVYAQSDVTLSPGVVIAGHPGAISLAGSGAAAGILRNQGVITADLPDTGLTISGPGLKNTGILRSEGGTLTLATSIKTADLGAIESIAGRILLTGTLDNGGATLELDDNTGPLAVGSGTIKGGTVSETGRGQLLFASSGRLEGVTVKGDLQLTSLQNVPQQVEITGGFACGQVLLDKSANLTFSGVQTVSAGAFVFGPAGGSVYVNPQADVTFGPGVSVSGHSGLVWMGGSGATSGILRNQGIITASSPGGTLTLSGPGLRNSGALRSAGGTLTLAIAVKTADLGTLESITGRILLTGIVDNTGATLGFNDSTGPLALAGGTITAGTVNESGRGLLLCAPNGRLEGVTVNGGLTVTNGQSLEILNGLTCNGTVLLDTGGTLSCKGVQTLDGATLALGSASGAGSVTLSDNASQLTFGAGVVIHGLQGSLGLSRTGTFVNRGLISADVAGATLTLNGLAFTNEATGIIEAAAAGARVTINASTFVDQGIRHIDNGGQIIVNP